MHKSETASRVVAGAARPEYWFQEGCHIAEWWNDPDDDAVSVVQARVPAGGVTRWHRLVGITERYLIRAGRGRVELGDRAPEAVAAGTTVVIPPGLTQRIVNTGDDELTFLAVCTPRFEPLAYEDAEP